MSELLKVIEIPNLNPNALMVEFPVDPRLSPALVSSTRDFLWVSNLKKGSVKAALRDYYSPEQVYQDIIHHVIRKGQQSQWENVHPLSEEGIQECISYLQEFGIDEVEILCSLEGIPSPFDISVVKCSWLMPSQVVVVPKDREFLGFISFLEEKCISVVHNAARGMAIALGQK